MNSKTVRVTRGTRDRLADAYGDKSHGSTVAALAGNYAADNRRTEGVYTGRKHTTIRVSENCHYVLKCLRDNMDVDTLGDTVAVLLAHAR